jgi:hypothetical protein
MKKMKQTGATFNQVLDIPQNQAKGHPKLYKIFTFMMIGVVLFSLYSCSRNVSSGCNSFPSYNSKSAYRR